MPCFGKVTIQRLVFVQVFCVTVCFVVSQTDSFDNADPLDEPTKGPTQTTGQSRPTRNANLSCSIRPIDPEFTEKISEIVEYDASYLIRYKLRFPLRSDGSNPLRTNAVNLYKGDSMFRVKTSHGETLLSLSFNYGILSLFTLTLGTYAYKADVREIPDNCLDGLSENETIDVALHLLARDFDPNLSNITIGKYGKICMNYIVGVNGYAEYKLRCYHNEAVEHTEEPTDVANKWINYIYLLLQIIKILLFLFGPLLFVSYVAQLSMESTPYIVKLKEPLLRTLFVARDVSDFRKVLGERILDLRRCRGYVKLKETLDNCPIGQPFRAKISQYDILAEHKRLILENQVPVTFLRALGDAIFNCKAAKTDALRGCCHSNIFSRMPCIKRRVLWISLVSRIGLALLIVFLPFLYYIRLVIFYFFEEQEIRERREAAKRLGLEYSVGGSLILYLTPTHPFFLSIYAIYFFCAVLLGFLTRRESEGRIRGMIVGSFSDLRQLSYLKVLQLVVENTVWPCKRCGFLGCCFAPCYWIIALPLTILVCTVYWIPLIYLTIRIFFFSRSAFLKKVRIHQTVHKYQTSQTEDRTIEMFKVGSLFGDSKDPVETGRTTMLRSRMESDAEELQRFRYKRSEKPRLKSDDEEDDASDASIVSRKLHIKPLSLLQHFFAALLCVTALFSLLMLVAESFGSLVEIAVFTIMGMIVNAGIALKYISLIIMIVVYSVTCFNMIKVRYLKLNKALFGEVKSHIKNLDKITSLQAHAQENQAFKSEEQSQQADYESPDNIADYPPRHWYINDLILFVDSQDAFRIPSKLFKEVCEIREEGVPGPIVAGIIAAIKQFIRLVIFVFFVFLIVLSFGNAYQVSSTTQSLAVLTGGMIPILFREFMKPPKPDIQLNSATFGAKLNEVIKNHWQLWPLCDFSFTVATEEDASPTPIQGKSPKNQAVPPSKIVDKDPQVPSKDIDEQSVKVHGSGSDVQQPERKAKRIRKKNKSENELKDKQSGSSVRSKGSDKKSGSSVPSESSRKNDSANNNSNFSNKQKPVGQGPKETGTVSKVDLLVRLPEDYEDKWANDWGDPVKVEVRKSKPTSAATGKPQTKAAKKVPDKLQAENKV